LKKGDINNPICSIERKTAMLPRENPGLYQVRCDQKYSSQL
jgi:hypothetical protein